MLGGAVFKALSSTLLSLLMIVTLLWGGCISCPQFFMFPTAKAEKSCCQKNGQCERPTKSAPAKDCKRLPLEPQGFASAHLELAAAADVLDTIIVLPQFDATSLAYHHEITASEHSPPDLNILHATFLI